MLKNPSGRTRLLVTHEIQVMKEVDYIYTMVEGRIAEEGSYSQLLANQGEFFRFISDYAYAENTVDDDNCIATSIANPEDNPLARMTANNGTTQTEERNTGAISWKVYATYALAGKGAIVLPFLILGLVLNQSTYVMSTYWYANSIFLGIATDKYIKARILGREVYFKRRASGSCFHISPLSQEMARSVFRVLCDSNINFRRKTLLTTLTRWVSMQLLVLLKPCFSSSWRVHLRYSHTSHRTGCTR